MRCIYIAFLLSWFFKSSAQEISNYQKILSLAVTNPDSAIILSNDYILSMIDQGNDTSLISGNYLLGLSNYYAGNYILAEKSFLKASEYCSNYPQYQAKKEASFNNVGICRELLGNLDGALDAYQLSLKIASEREDSIGIMQTKINIGLLEIKLKRSNNGKRILLETESYFKRIKDSSNLGLVYQNLGLAANAEKNFGDLINYSLMALDIFDKLNFLPSKLEALNNLGVAYLEIGNFKTSIKYLTECYSLAKENDLLRAKAFAAKNLGSYCQRINKLELAEKFYLEGKELFIQLNNLEQLEIIFFEIIQLYALSGNYPALQHLITEFKENKQTLLNVQSIQKIDELKQLFVYEEQQKIIQNQEEKIRLEQTKKRAFAILSTIFLTLLLISIRFYYVDKKRLDMIFRLNQIKNEASEINSSKAISNQSNEQENLYHSVIQLISENKLYLNHNLSIQDVSKLLHTNDKYISEAINKIGKKKWNELINHFRIQDVLSFLHNSNHSIKVKLIELAFQKGFNSRITFYRAFKNETGLSPQQYLDRINSIKK